MSSFWRMGEGRSLPLARRRSRDQLPLFSHERFFPKPTEWKRDALPSKLPFLTTPTRSIPTSLEFLVALNV
jgi:hypothetical protein